MKPWHEIYRDRMNESYRNHVASKYAPFVASLYEAKGCVYTEIGCGAGNITRLLREMMDGSHRFHLVDSCPKMLGLAVENNPSPDCDFRCADVRDIVMPRGDVLHSHGLLEHFRDSDIQAIVRQGFEAAPLQIHYVPSVEYKKPSRGDERLMSPKQWRQILSGFGFATDVQQFNNGLDLIIRIARR